MTARLFVCSAVRQKTVHVGVSLYFPCYRFSGAEKQVRQTEQSLQITGSHSLLAYHSSWNMRLPALTLSQVSGFLCCKISFCSQTVFAAKDLPKALKLHLAERQLPHSSLHPLLNIRQKLSQLAC